MNKVLPAKYVYEFDIKGFFNNVSILQVISLLRERGVPLKQREWLLNMLHRIPENIAFEDPKNSAYDEQLATRKFVMDMEAKI